MKQKFGMLSFVHVCKDMPESMSHFEKDFDAIVEGTYSQLCGGGHDIKSYSVYQIKGGRIVNEIAWYKEDQLTLLPDQDRDKAEAMIEKYNLRQQSCNYQIEFTYCPMCGQKFSLLLI